MNNLKRNVLTVVLALFASVAQADIIVYDMTNTTAQTLKSLGTNFVIGCTVLTLGIIIAAVISRKK